MYLPLVGYTDHFPSDVCFMAAIIPFRKFPEFEKFFSVPTVQKNRNMYNFRKFLNISGNFT